MSFAFKRGEHPPKQPCAACGRVVAHRRAPGGLTAVRHKCVESQRYDELRKAGRLP